MTGNPADANETETEAVDDPREQRECELCGETVPAATYHEHLLKECSGR